MALAFGGSLSIFILAGSGTFQLSRELTAYAVGIPAFALFVLWRSARARVSATPSASVSR